LGQDLKKYAPHLSGERMKIIKSILLIYLVTGMLAACRGFTPPPTATPGQVEETVVVISLPPMPPPTVTSVSPGDRIVFYYFVPLTGSALPEGSVVIMPEAYFLAPQLSESAYTPEPTADLRTALDYALNDARNGWKSTNLEILEISFGEGHADIVLQGEYYGVGSVTLIAARMQILLTLFANPAVETATVTLNGDTIGNLGIAHSLEAKAVDYVFTRAEIEAFQAANQSVTP
jgi:hypothetical protein